jgi:hypothetical protein
MSRVRGEKKGEMEKRGSGEGVLRGIPVLGNEFPGYHRERPLWRREPVGVGVVRVARPFKAGRGRGTEQPSAQTKRAGPEPALCYVTNDDLFPYEEKATIRYNK